MKLEEVKKIITPVLEANSVEYAGVFGSVARDEAKPESDVDILVKFTGPGTFTGFLRLDEGLRKSLGRDIDLITEGAGNKFFRPYIERDIQIVYGQKSDLPVRD